MMTTWMRRLRIEEATIWLVRMRTTYLTFEIRNTLNQMMITKMIKIKMLRMMMTMMLISTRKTWNNLSRSKM